MSTAPVTCIQLNDNPASLRTHLAASKGLTELLLYLRQQVPVPLVRIREHLAHINGGGGVGADGSFLQHRNDQNSGSVHMLPSSTGSFEAFGNDSSTSIDNFNNCTTFPGIIPRPDISSTSSTFNNFDQNNHVSQQQPDPLEAHLNRNQLQQLDTLIQQIDEIFTILEMQYEQLSGVDNLHLVFGQSILSPIEIWTINLNVSSGSFASEPLGDRDHFVRTCLQRVATASVFYESGAQSKRQEIRLVLEMKNGCSLLPRFQIRRDFRLQKQKAIFKFAGVTNEIFQDNNNNNNGEQGSSSYYVWDTVLKGVVGV